MELNTKYEITVDPNEISCAGVLKIDDYLASENLPYAGGPFISKWIDTEGEYRGKLPNRLGALYKKVCNIKLTSEQRTTIGNIAKAHLSRAKYEFDFVDKFDWEDGDFGDRGSCYWGGRNLARSVLEEEGALAIRFYMGDKNGRAWIYQLDRETWIVFNAYGLETRTAAKTLAEYLTQDTDEQWKYMELDTLAVTDYVTTGLVYINRHPQIVFVEDTLPPLNVNLEWDDYVVCESCEEWVLLENMSEIDGDNICCDCASAYMECYSCGDLFSDGNLDKLEEEFYCAACYNRRDAEIEEELRLERLELRRAAAQLIEETEEFINGLTYDEELAAGQLEFRFVIQMDIEARKELEELQAWDAAGRLSDPQSGDGVIAIDYAHQEGMMAERLAIRRSQPYHPGNRSPGAEAPA